MTVRILIAAALLTACGAPQPAPAPEPAPAAEPAPAPAKAKAPAKSGIPQRKDDADRKSKNGLTKTKVGAVDVEVHYGRPSANGRTIWGELVPYGKVWRTGADEATTITFSDKVKFGDKPVDAGTYALFTIPGEKAWTLILNGQAEQWGSYDYDASKDVARIEVKPKAHDATEAFTIDATKKGLVLKWADVGVPVPLSQP